MARKRPTASNVVPPTHTGPEPAALIALTRAEAHALRRSAPLTPGQSEALRHLAEHGISPLRHV